MKNFLIKKIYDNKFKNALFITGITLFSVGINYCGSLLAETIVFPLYLDSILSIGVVALCGYLPGVICALGSNVLLSIYTKSTFLFSICHVMTVTFAAIVFLFFKNTKDKTYIIDSFLWAGIWSALSNGIVGNIIAELAFSGNTGRPSANVVVQGIYCAFPNLSFANNLGGLIENVADKTLSAVLSYVFYRLIISIINKRATQTE